MAKDTPGRKELYSIPSEALPVHLSSTTDRLVCSSAGFCRTCSGRFRLVDCLGTVLSSHDCSTQHRLCCLTMPICWLLCNPCLSFWTCTPSSSLRGKKKKASTNMCDHKWMWRVLTMSDLKILQYKKFDPKANKIHSRILKCTWSLLRMSNKLWHDYPTDGLYDVVLLTALRVDAHWYIAKLPAYSRVLDITPGPRFAVRIPAIVLLIS
jgi:hypothetical protein